MNIYTSYFAKIKKLPKHIIPIAISLSVPNGYTGLGYKYLAPTWDILSQYKSDNDEEAYIEKYRSTILNKLSVERVVYELGQLSQGNDIALICYEKSGAFCHRNIVAKWLKDNGVNCFEIQLK